MAAPGPPEHFTAAAAGVGVGSGGVAVGVCAGGVAVGSDSWIAVGVEFGAGED